MSKRSRVNRAKYARAQEYIRTGAWIVDPDAGQVISRRTGGPLKARLDDHGYRVYGVCLPGGAPPNYTVIPVKAARVIFESVHGPVPDGLEVNHMDGVKTNDRISNLEAITAAGNIQHAYRTGLNVAKCGEQSSAARLTESQVLEIRRLLSQGIPQRVVAARYGLSQSNVSSIYQRRTWRNVV